MHVDDGWKNERKKELTVCVIFPLLYFALLVAAFHFIIGANLLWYKINNDNNKKRSIRHPSSKGYRTRWKPNWWPKRAPDWIRKNHKRTLFCTLASLLLFWSPWLEAGSYIKYNIINSLTHNKLTATTLSRCASQIHSIPYQTN